MGIAKSSRAADSVVLNCPGDTCKEPEPVPEPTPTPVPGPEPAPEPTPEPEPPEPTPTPDPPAPSPTPPDSSDDTLFWLWIVIGLSSLLVIVVAIAVYYCRRSAKAEELNAIIYSQNTNGGDPQRMLEAAHSGDMIAQDIEIDASGKREARKSHFADHADIMRETGISEDPNVHQPSPTSAGNASPTSQ